MNRFILLPHEKKILITFAFILTSLLMLVVGIYLSSLATNTSVTEIVKTIFRYVALGLGVEI